MQARDKVRSAYFLNLCRGVASIVAAAPSVSFVEDRGCGAVRIEGSEVRYDPEFVDTLSMPQLVAVMEHELWHSVSK